jgi:Gpi18-like mannosyltransferase
MLSINRPSTRSLSFWPLFARIVVAALFILAIVVRVLFYHVQTSDYTIFVSQWYDFIKAHGFAAFKDDFANYNPPYLYLIGLTTLLPIPKLVALKSLSVVFDAVLALFTYLLVRLKYGRGFAALVSALVLVWAPTIIINSSAWGQCDAIYVSFCLGSLYFLLTKRYAWACVFFALAISFKLQAVFFAPVLLLFVLKRMLPLKYLLLIPAIFLLLLAPSFIAGRSATSLLMIYPAQAGTGGTGGGQFNGAGFNGRGYRGGNGFNGQRPTIPTTPGGSGNPGNGQQPGTPPSGNNPYGSYRGGTHLSPSNANGNGLTSPNFSGFSSSSSLTLNAPSFYQWLPASAPQFWKWLGIALAGLFILLIAALLLKSKQALTTALALKIALVFALAIPFLLPEMHERYFYLADAISIVYAFYFPRLSFVAVITQLCSLFSYSPYFFHVQIIPLGYIAGAVLCALLIVLIDLLFVLYPRARNILFVPEESTPKDSEVTYSALS